MCNNDSDQDDPTDPAIAAILARFAPGCEAELSIAQGWYGLLVELDKQLVALHPDIRYREVKKKFTEMRVYTTCDGDPTVIRLAFAAADRATTTCEVCGAGGAELREPAEARLGAGGMAGGAEHRTPGYRVRCAAHAEVS